MKSIATVFTRYADSIGLERAGPEQRAETRRAFYAGFIGCCASMQRLADEPEDYATRQIDAWFNEAQTFVKSVKAGDL